MRRPRGDIRSFVGRPPDSPVGHLLQHDPILYSTGWSAPGWGPANSPVGHLLQGHPSSYSTGQSAPGWGPLTRRWSTCSRVTPHHTQWMCFTRQVSLLQVGPLTCSRVGPCHNSGGVLSQRKNKKNKKSIIVRRLRRIVHVSGAWGMGSPQWGVGSPQWGKGSPQWGVGSREWGVVSHLSPFSCIAAAGPGGGISFILWLEVLPRGITPCGGLLLFVKKRHRVFWQPCVRKAVHRE